MTNRGMAATGQGTMEKDMYSSVEKVFLVLRDIFIIFTLLFFLLRLDSYLFNRGLLPAAPIYLLAGWIAAVGLLGLLSTSFERHYPVSFYRCWPIILPFIAIMALSWIGIFGEQAFFGDNYKFLLITTLDFGLFLTGILIGIMKMRKGILSMGITIAWATLIITSFTDILYPGTFSLVDTRAAGLFEDPNEAAFSIVLFTSVLLSWDKKAMNLRDLFIFAVCGVAVFFTFSRGGAIEFLMLAFLYWINLTNRHRFYSIIQIAVFIILLSVGVSFLLPDYISQLKILEVNSYRVGWFFGDFGGAFATSDPRVGRLWEAVALVGINPFFGLGTGYVASMSPYGPHNIFLGRWIDNGVFGMLSYVWLLAAALVMNKTAGNFGGVAAVVTIILYGLVSHTALDDRVILLVMSIITARAIVNRANQNEKPSKISVEG